MTEFAGAGAWPDGNGPRASANCAVMATPRHILMGARAFNDEAIAELRGLLQRSKRITTAGLVAWDLLICFGLRPAELHGLELLEGMAVAQVRRVKRSSRDSSGPRIVPALHSAA